MRALKPYPLTAVLPGLALAAVVATGAELKLKQSAIPAIAAVSAGVYLAWVKTRLDERLRQIASSDDFVIVGDAVRLKKDDKLVVDLGAASILSLERWVVLFPAVGAIAPLLKEILGREGKSISSWLVASVALLVIWAARTISREEERVLRIAEAREAGLRASARLSEDLTAPSPRRESS